MTVGSKLSPGRVTAMGSLLALVVVGLPGAVSAAVGGALRTITPTAATIGGTFVDPTCGNQGGTSIAIVQGSKLAGVDAARYPVLLAITCLDNTDVTKRSQVNFIDPSSGTVITSIRTVISGAVAAPGNGWAHLVHRPDKGDLLGCGKDGTIYSIDFSQFPTSTDDGTATQLPRPSTLSKSCGGLAWDTEEDTIYQGLTAGPGQLDIARFKDGTTAILGTVNTPATCTPSGLAITGGVLIVACDGSGTILRFDKTTGTLLSPNGTLSALVSNPDLGDLACDPVTFSGQFRDALWSRNGVDGNGVVALEFPPFTCGLPPNATVLWAGLSVPTGGQPGALPRAECFDKLIPGTIVDPGNIVDADGDGLPDCWENGALWPDNKPGIDFDGDGNRDLVLCVDVDTNGDGVVDATECADRNHKDLFVEIDWMRDHKPDPLALSQTQSVASVGVKSVREAFGAAPVALNPDGTGGIRIHLQVDEQAGFTALDGTTKSHVDLLVFTPCTGPASFVPAASQGNAADFDTIKKANLGTAAERLSGANTLNAKRLAFRYVLFGHNQVNTQPPPASAGSTSSGCAELGGDDAAVTLGSFATTTVGGVSHPRGLTDQQAGTFMHEFGHLLGLRHGGGDNINCKPNYRSVMSYSRQFAGSPIPNRRLDYSRAEDPFLASTLTCTVAGRLNEGCLNEFDALGLHPSRDVITQGGVTIFGSPDQIAFGPSALSVVSATGTPINWNRSKQGPNPTFQDNAATNINQGPGGCDGAGTVLEGYHDWENLLYRASAALDFAGGVRSDTPQEITKDQEEELFQAADLDANGVADAQDCGTFLCTHRIDIKPSFPLPKLIDQSLDSTISVVIFSEKSGALVWSAPAQVQQDASLKLNGISVKVNQNGQGTCSESDIADPVTGTKDGVKDLKCQFPTAALEPGTQFGVVTGLFFDAPTGEFRGFIARQLIDVVP